MATVKVGYRASVKLGTDTVSEMGTWSLDGITVDLLDATSFGDEFKEYVLGVGDYGTVSFGGFYNMSDTTGQKVLWSAMENKSKINNIRFYIDNTSYYAPNTSFGDGGITDAGIWIQSIKIGFQKYGIGTIDFTGKATGPFKLY